MLLATRGLGGYLIPDTFANRWRAMKYMIRPAPLGYAEVEIPTEISVAKKLSPTTEPEIESKAKTEPAKPKRRRKPRPNVDPGI